MRKAWRGKIEANGVIRGRGVRMWRKIAREWRECRKDGVRNGVSVFRWFFGLISSLKIL
jgi:hypothetical protein